MGFLQELGNVLGVAGEAHKHAVAVHKRAAAGHKSGSDEQNLAHAAAGHVHDELRSAFVARSQVHPKRQRFSLLHLWDRQRNKVAAREAGATFDENAGPLATAVQHGILVKFGWKGDSAQAAYRDNGEEALGPKGKRAKRQQSTREERPQQTWPAGYDAQPYTGDIPQSRALVDTRSDAEKLAARQRSQQRPRRGWAHLLARDDVQAPGPKPKKGRK